MLQGLKFFPISYLPLKMKSVIPLYVESIELFVYWLFLLSFQVDFSIHTFFPKKKSLTFTKGCPFWRRLKKLEIVPIALKHTTINLNEYPQLLKINLEGLWKTNPFYFVRLHFLHQFRSAFWIKNYSIPSFWKYSKVLNHCSKWFWKVFEVLNVLPSQFFKSLMRKIPFNWWRVTF